jgi:hypothetical protein
MPDSSSKSCALANTTETAAFGYLARALVEQRAALRPLAIRDKRRHDERRAAVSRPYNLVCRQKVSSGASGPACWKKLFAASALVPGGLGPSGRKVPHDPHYPDDVHDLGDDRDRRSLQRALIISPLQESWRRRFPLLCGNASIPDHFRPARAAAADDQLRQSFGRPALSRQALLLKSRLNFPLGQASADSLEPDG